MCTNAIPAIRPLFSFARRPRHFPSLHHIVYPRWLTNLQEVTQLRFICADSAHQLHGGRRDWMHSFQWSICFLKSQDETKVIPYSKIKRWKKGQKRSIGINKTKSTCTCTGYNTINNIGKNLAWRYVPGNYSVPSSCTRHNSGESNLHYSALDLERSSSSISGPDTSSIWGVIWSWWTFAV